MPDNDYDALFAPAARPVRSPRYDDLITRHAQRTGLDPELVRAVVVQESGGNPRAVSPKGAQGIGQLMPATARRFNVTDPFDPDQNIRGATDYLKFLSDRYKGNRDLVLAGYNAGEGAVDRFGGIPPYRETRNYVQSINRRLGQSQESRSSSNPYDALFDSSPQQQSPPAVAPPPRPSRQRQAELRAQRPSSIYGRAFGPPDQQRTEAMRQIVAESELEPTRAAIADFERNQPRSLGELRQLDDTRRPASVAELRQQDEPRAREIQREQRISREVARNNPLLDPRVDPRGHQRVVAQRAQQEREDEAKAQRDAPRLAELTAQYRQQIKDAAAATTGFTPLSPQWTQEVVSKAGAGLAQLGAGVTRPFSTDTADTINLHAQALQRAAEEEGADRNRVSKAIQNVVAGTISSLPEMAAMRAGLRAPITFGAGGAARSYGRGERMPQVVQAGAHGAATGAVFDAPAALGITNPLARVATVGAGTGALELATGQPLDVALETGATNALMAGVGEVGRPRVRPAAPEQIAQVEGRSTIPGYETGATTRAQRETRVRPPITPQEVERLQSLRPPRPVEQPVPEPQPVIEPVPAIEQAIISRAARADRLTQLQGELAQWQRAGGKGRRGAQRIRQIQGEMDDIRQSLQAEDQAAAAQLSQRQQTAVESTRYSPTPRFDEWVENQTGQRMGQLSDTELAPLRDQYRQEFASAPQPPIMREMPPLEAPVIEHHSLRQPRRQRGEGKGQFKKGKPASIEVPEPAASPEAVGEVAQLETLRRGDRDVVLYPQGTAHLGNLPEGLSREPTSVGTFVFNPQKISRELIRRKVSDGTYSEIPRIGSVVDLPPQPAVEPPVELTPRPSATESQLPTEKGGPEPVTTGGALDTPPVERRSAERTPEMDWLNLTPEEQIRARNELEMSQRFPAEPQPAQVDILNEPVRPSRPIVTTPVTEPTTAAKRASMSADRAELDLPELPATERRSWQETLDKAKERGTANAAILAEQVLRKPRSLNDVETGQLVLRAQEIKNQLSALRQEIVNDPSPERLAQSDALQEEFNRLTQAAKASGTEKGRTLAAQKLTINRDYDLTSLIQRATEAKGRKLTPTETTRYEQMAQRIAELESQVSTKAAKSVTTDLQREIDRVSRQRKRNETKQLLDEEFAQLKVQFAQARAEARNVQASGLAGLDPEGKITPLVARMAKNRIKAGIQSAEALVSEIYEAVKAHGWSRDDVAYVIRTTINQSDDVLSRWDKRRQGQLIKQQEELNRRLEQRDFSPKPSRQPPIYNRETQRLQEQVQSLKNKFDLEMQREQPGHFWRTLSGLRKSWMLSGLSTQAKNIGGTGGYQVFEEVARLPAAIADAAIAPLTGRRTLTTSPAQMLDAVLHARRVGLREAGQILRRGATPEQMERHQFSEIDTGVKVIDFASNLVFRFMSASDRVFHQYAYKRSLNDRAMAQAKNEGAGRQRAKELADNPPEELDAAAKHDALVATFNNNNRLSDAIKSARARLGPKANFAIDIIMPFDRTPTNVIARVLEASPVGLGQSAYRAAKAIINKSMTPVEQRQFSQTLGRATVGTALLALGWKLADDTFDIEDNGQVFLNVGSRRFNLNSISPVGNLLATGAKLKHDYNKGSGLDAAKTLARTPLDQPLLRAGSEVTELLRDPERSAARTGARIASSFIPFGGAARDVAKALDPEERRFPDPKSFTQQVQQNLPVLRERLPVARSKVFQGQTTSSPATKEIARLDMSLKGAMQGDTETPEQFRQRQQAMNPAITRALEQLVQSPAYARLSDEEKKKQIRSVVQSIAAAFRVSPGSSRRPSRPSRREARP